MALPSTTNCARLTSVRSAFNDRRRDAIDLYLGPPNWVTKDGRAKAVYGGDGPHTSQVLEIFDGGGLQVAVRANFGPRPQEIDHRHNM